MQEVESILPNFDLECLKHMKKFVQFAMTMLSVKKMKKYH